MTLDEAIEHSKDVAENCDDEMCAREHAQLAEWLKELRAFRNAEISCYECKYFTDFHTGAGGCRSIDRTVGAGWSCANAERPDNDDA